VEIELVKQAATSGGGVVVCLALVVLFLKHIAATNDAHQASIRDITDKFSQQHDATNAAFQTQIGILTGKVFEVAEKTAGAVSELKGAINELRARITT
jgi:hypothetical protein